MALLFRKILLSSIQRGNINLQKETIRKFVLNSRTFNSIQKDEKDKSSLLPSSKGLVLSDSCLKRLREICDDGSFLRIIIEGGGCSGFQYKFELDQKLTDEDLVFGEDKAKVVIDETSLEYCNGATVDFQSEIIRSGFRIIGNPQADKGCSCGASFAVKFD